ncbi:ComEC/Rec2 family competence protein [Flavobacterium pedocola]
MKVAKFPIFIISTGFCLGITADHFAAFKPLTVIVFCLTTLLILVVAGRIAKKDLVQKNYFGFAVLLTAVSCGLLAHCLQSEVNYDHHYSHYSKKENNLIIGTIAERLKPNAYAEKYYLKISQINKQGASGKILLTVPKKEFPKQFKAGSQLMIYADLQSIPKSINPYQFDYAGYLEKQQVYHQIYLKKQNTHFLALKQNKDYHIEHYRNTLLNSFQIHHFSETQRNIIKALLLGQRQDLDAAINQEYTDTGVVHILAISGLHIAILYAMLQLLLTPLSRFRKGKLWQLVISLGLLWSFALLSGMSASVVRSVVMFSFMSFGLYLNKTSNMYHAMAVSALTILFFKPNFLFDVGFQLSYAAVFAIVWLQPLFRNFYSGKSRIVRYLLDLAIISIIAQIGVLPISLYYFHQFPSLFLVANLVVIPLSSIILVFGVFILLMNFIWPQASVFLGQLLSLSIELMNTYIAWIASFRDFTLKEIPFTLPLLISLYLLIGTGVFWFYRKTYHRLTALLFSGMVFQIVVLYSMHQSRNQNEFVVFNNKKTSLLAEKRNNTILVYTDEPQAAQNQNLKVYNRGNFNQRLEIHPLENTAFYKDKRILIVDSTGIYNSLTKKPEIVLLTQSAKINLERLILTLHPKQIIADGSNYRKTVVRWKATCEKEKIPFHATAEKGFYRIN